MSAAVGVVEAGMPAPQVPQHGPPLKQQAVWVGKQLQQLSEQVLRHHWLMELVVSIWAQSELRWV